MASSDWRTLVSGGRVVSATGRIVETDQRDVLGNPTAALVEHRQRAGSHEVVGGEQAVEVGAALEQRAHRPRAAVLGEVPGLDHHRVDLPTGVAHGLPIAGETIDGGRHVGRTG